MAAGLESPAYLSARSADVILSEVRPIRLAPTALRALNVLLDELLWTILATARSIETERLNQALRKVLPTPLGKEALLEAEVELRAYLEKSSPPSAQPKEEGFALQYAFELLRIKCEAYSTLNDHDENTEEEAKLHAKNGEISPPRASLLAPAALYLTAILECVCEHILSMVSRVAARDSSRTAATAQDLFVALCEDHAIFELFKTMKVYAQIESMTHESGHNRRKSYTQPGERPPSRTSSPGEAQGSKTSGRRPSISSIKARVSSENKRSRAASPALRRASMEKARALAELVGGPRSSSEHERPIHGESSGATRMESGLSENTKQVWRAFHDAVGSDRSSDPEDDGGLDFDEALRSGSTVKVSLTPDRLKSMEAYKQSRRGGSKLASDPLSPVTPSDEDTTPIVPSAVATATRQALLGTRRPSAPQVPQVDSIKEDDEEGPSPAVPSTAPPIPPRRRNGSFAAPSSAPPSKTPEARQRTMSAAAQAAPRATDLFAPKPKLVQSPMPNRSDHAPSAFPQKKRVVARRRESLDLDDIMNGSEDEDEEEGQATDTTNHSQVLNTPRTVRTAGAVNTPGTPQTPGGGVSRSTRDLMDFLESGPPMEPEPIQLSRQNTGDRNASVKKGRSGGRLQRMVSRLTRGVSQEQLSKRARDDAFTASSTPPLPAAALGSGGFAGASRVNVGGTTVVAFKPPRPPRPPQAPQIEPTPNTQASTSTILPASSSATSVSTPTATPSFPISPPASPSTPSLTEERAKATGTSTPVQVPTPPATSAQRRLSIQRKAVPQWDEIQQVMKPRTFEPTSGSSTPALQIPETSDSRSGVALHTPESSGDAATASPVLRSPILEKVEPLRPIRKNSGSPRSSPSSTTAPSSLPPSVKTASNHFTRSAAPSPSPSAVFDTGTPLRNAHSVPDLSPGTESAQGAPVAVPNTEVQSSKTIPPSVEDLKELRALMMRANSAEECRLLLDMILLRSGVELFPTAPDFTVPYPSPMTSDSAPLPSASTASASKALPALDINPEVVSPVEPSVLEILLGGGGGSVPSTPVYSLHMYGHDRNLSVVSDAEFHSVSASPIASPARERFVYQN